MNYYLGNNRNWFSTDDPLDWSLIDDDPALYFRLLRNHLSLDDKYLFTTGLSLLE